MWSTIPISEPLLSSLSILYSDVNGKSNINSFMSCCFSGWFVFFHLSSSAIQNDTNTMMGKRSAISKAHPQNQPNGFKINIILKLSQEISDFVLMSN